jgi:hypothetical protein
LSEIRQHAIELDAERGARRTGREVRVKLDAFGRVEVVEGGAGR